MDAMDEQPLHLQRDMTHGTFRRYLEARKELAELASVLIVGVDGNSLINLHAGCEKPDSAILAQAFMLSDYYDKAAQRIALARRLHTFLLAEKEAVRLAKKTKKSNRSAEKSTNLEAAMHAEKKSRVTAEHGNLLFQANVASSEYRSTTKDQRERERREKSGTTFNVTLPNNLQEHHAYLLKHLDAVLNDLSPHPPLTGGKLVGEIGREKKKGKGKAAVAEVRAVAELVGMCAYRPQPPRPACLRASTCSRSTCRATCWPAGLSSASRTARTCCSTSRRAPTPWRSSWLMSRLS